MENQMITPSCRRRLNIQGYYGFTDQELKDYRTGIRFAYALCATLVIIGLIIHNIPLLIITAVFAFGGAFPPYHPFDYLYNYVIRHFIKKPKLPHRTNQGRFACGVAATWLVGIIISFYFNQLIIGYVLGIIMVALATLVSTVDICIPSMVYNFLFLKKKDK